MFMPAVANSVEDVMAQCHCAYWTICDYSATIVKLKVWCTTLCVDQSSIKRNKVNIEMFMKQMIHFGLGGNLPVEDFDKYGFTL